MNEYKKYNRHSIRLKGFDYAKPGSYFITICARDRKCLFGEILDRKMKLNKYGNIVKKSWEWLGKQYDYVEIHQYTVMPNHIHGIITLTPRRGVSRNAPTGEIKRKTIGRLIGAFKTVSTKKINQLYRTPGEKLWQRDFYEYIIRDIEEYMSILKYIEHNPVNWKTDDLNKRALCYYG